MAINDSSRDPIPSAFDPVERAADFWDTHDLTDYDDVWKEAELIVQLDPSKLIDDSNGVSEIQTC